MYFFDSSLSSLGELFSFAGLLHALGLVAIGALVGLAVGLTGVGGGSLMTPALIYGFGVPTIQAVGTDLAFASLTKSVGIVSHGKQGWIHWPTARLMILASLPGCLLGMLALSWFKVQFEAAGGSGAEFWIKQAIALALVLTALSILWNSRPKAYTARLDSPLGNVWLVVGFFVIGALVAISSIGAGAIGCALLTWTKPSLSAKQIAATDIAYAVPLTAVAAIGHGLQGHIDYILLAALLVGSTPAIALGAMLAKRLPNSLLRRALAFMLAAVAVKSWI